jgi:acyl-CoA thioesterase FadM
MKEYTFEYTVRLDDLDFMNVVGDNQWLVFLQRARIELMDRIGFPYTEMIRQKIGGVVAENHIRYMRPAVFGAFPTPFRSAASNNRSVTSKEGSYGQHETLA